MGTVSHDVAIVGSGFAGSVLARVLARRGRRVALIERGRHPRFALGESSTPLASLALERLAARHDLPDLHQMATYGRWRRALPRLRCGLKRGFTFFHHRPGQPFRNASHNDARLLVAASPSDAIADCHWLRADVDAHLVACAAEEERVDYADRTHLHEASFHRDHVSLRGERDGHPVSFRVRELVDGSGPSGFLARQLAIDDAPLPLDTPTRLLYSHFDLSGAPAFAEVAHTAGAAMPHGPYPDERAAVHHLLDEGWCYVLPFDHGVASIGLVLRRLPHGLDDARAAHEPDVLWHAMLDRYPSLAAQLAQARPVRSIAFVPRIQHRLARATGDRWTLLPHSFAFVDPMFSTGIAWSLLAVERLADMLCSESVDPRKRARYDALLLQEADQIERLIALAYRTRNDFDAYAATTFLYFALVSFEEVRQRIRPTRNDAWCSLLGADDPERTSLLRRAASRFDDEQTRGTYADWVRHAIGRWNVAGVADPDRDNLYPLDLDVLVDRADLLGLSTEEVRAALPRLRGDGET